MVRLIEQIPYKLPGETSFRVEFDYDPRIVDVLRQIPNSIFHKKLKSWEIPSTSLSRAVMLLYNIESIDIKLMDFSDNDDCTDIKLNEDEYKTNLYGYQKDGIIYGLNHKKWLLLDSPGLGKTLQMIYLAKELKDRGEINHCLVICGVNSLKHNWKMEISKHSDLSSMILGSRVSKKGVERIGSISDRLYDLKHKIDEFFVITNLETLRNSDIVRAINDGVNKFDMIICDEVHKIKTPTSQQSKGLLKLKSEYKIALTGTLLTNTPLDVYAPLKWLEIDNSTYTNFKYYYCTYGGPFGNELIGYKNLDVLKDQLANHSLRRTKDLLELPPKTIIKEYLTMSEEQSDFYSSVEQGIIDESSKIELNPANILSMCIRLRQATVSPFILSSKDIESVKVERALELIDEIISSGEKVLVFSVFKAPLNNIVNRISKYNPVLCTGDVSDSEINILKERFQTDDSCKVMCATTQKVGTGFTLTAASYAIFLDTPWTSAEYQQAQDRIHRIGAKSPVFIYELITKGTIDERVSEIVETKEALSDYVIDDKLDSKTIDLLSSYINGLKNN